MNIRFQILSAALFGLLLSATTCIAQSVVSEDFTGASTVNPWYFSGAACLTASGAASVGGTEFTSSVVGVPGTVPGCTSIRSNSDAYNGETLVGGYSGTFPDPVNNGALRFTNGCTNGSNCGSNGGHNQFGAIISGASFSSSAGVQVTFKTVTYRGDAGGTGDGADGISFFLQDASYNPGIGQYGGSLAYSCSNNNGNYGYGGMVGGYIGLGIDEYGNFLNGVSNTLGETVNYSNGPDNTASGGTYQPNRIGMRGAGNVAWSWLHANYPAYYPSTLPVTGTNSQYSAVQKTCQTGTLWNYGVSTPVNTGLTSTSGSPTLLDYAAIPNAYKVLSGVTIANEYSNGGLLRANATPIQYKVKITSAGLLSLSYSYNGGAYQSVLSNQSITASNGTLPANVRFGFAGSTGGSSNIHEVLCFKAASADTSGSSAATNQTQSSRITSSTQAYFAYYDPNDWTGRLTANAVTSDSSGNISIATTATWDASCVLTGGACASTGATSGTAEAPTSRVILSWNPTQGAGVPFEYNLITSAATLTAAQEIAINQGDVLPTALRLNYLRGDRSQEVTTVAGVTVGLFRDRDSVLGDIIDSSPSAVGQPVAPYAITWKDRLYATATMPENGSTAQTYATFTANNLTRENIVYVGANDGMLHGFRAGAFNSSDAFVGTTNDGSEVLAYVPGTVVQSAANSTTSAACTSINATQTVVQNIHGETPAIGVVPACTQATLDYANPQYGHNFFVDGSPATGDLFYGATASTEQWHTWLVGGMGAGGAAIYALDVTTPSNFSESNASSLVIGEWSASTSVCIAAGNCSISCSGNASCGLNLGNTYGTPLIRRMHNGMWAIIFGNGFGSSTGDAGVFIVTINPASGAKTFYYLSTGKSGTGDGIAYVTSADLDGDHVTDYLYAGDLLGNVWRFDVTSQTPNSWAASSAPIFSAGSTHPITTALVLAVVSGNAPGTQVMVGLGTGQKVPLTNTSGASYASATQYMAAFWDWNMSSWNTASPGVQYASLAGSATGIASPYTISSTYMTQENLTLSGTSTVDLTASTICWRGTVVCGTSATSNTSFGWYAALPNTNEQIIFNPQLVGPAFNVNSLIPANNSLLSCSVASDTGYTYLIAMATGGVPAAGAGATNGNPFINTTTYNASGNIVTTYSDANAVGVQSNMTGTATVLTATAVAGGSANIQAAGTANSVSCTLAGTCTPTISANGTSGTGNSGGSVAMFASPFASVAGCAAPTSCLAGKSSTSSSTCVTTSLQCPLVGSRATRTQVR
jgi:type IV pilus assembly protein PilY1